MLINLYSIAKNCDLFLQVKELCFPVLAYSSQMLNQPKNLGGLDSLNFEFGVVRG